MEITKSKHSSQVTTIVKSSRGVFVKLTAVVNRNWLDGTVEVDIWGQVDGKGNPIYPPSVGDKPISDYDSIDDYVNSPDRGLFYYISHGQYLALAQQAIEQLA